MRIPMRRLFGREVSIFFLLAVSLILPGAPTMQSATPNPVTISVPFHESQGALDPIWNYFGYDEPNYTYAANGKKLLGELAEIGAAPFYVRVHNLFTSGDGSASLKWGST